MSQDRVSPVRGMARAGHRDGGITERADELRALAAERLTPSLRRSTR
jgi:hypothetical protein